MKIATLILLFSQIVLAAGGGHGDDHIPWTTIQTQMINLGILIVVLIYFIRTPLKNSFKAKRDQFIEDSQKTELALKQAELELKDAKDKLALLEKTEQQSIIKAEVESQMVANKIVADASVQGEKMVQDTELIIKAEVEQAKRNIRKKIIDISLSSAANEIKNTSESITKKSETGFLSDLEQVKP